METHVTCKTASARARVRACAQIYAGTPAVYAWIRVKAVMEVTCFKLFRNCDFDKGMAAILINYLNRSNGISLFK